MQCNAKYLITLRPTLILQIKQNNTNTINNTNKHTKIQRYKHVNI